MSKVTKSHYSFEEYVDIRRWISYYYQLVYCLSSKQESILIIGKGDGVLETLIKKYNPSMSIVTFDNANDLNPDVVGDVTELSSFFKGQTFSVVVCCQVLEHLPFERFAYVLNEIGKVIKNDGKLVLSLPDSGICPDFYMHIPKLGDFRIFLKLCKFYRNDFAFNGQHYWEINGSRKHHIKKVRSIIENVFDIKEEFLVPLNAYHRFFICKYK